MTMTRTLLSIVLVLAFVSGKAQETTADGYFNLASKEYVKQDKMQALRTLDKGLAQFPGDVKLLKLAEELIKEDENKQQQQDQQKQDQDKKDQQDKDKNKQDQKDKDQQEQEKKDQQEKQDKEGQEKKDQEKQGQEGKEQEPKDQKPQPGTIAPQDAMRMLEALDRQEQGVQDKVREKLRPSNPQKIEKDW